MTASVTPGYIFAFDGIDGSGKTTALVLLAQMLADKYGKDRIIQLRQPGGTALGAELRRIVKDTDYAPTSLTERLIMAADNAQMIEEIVQPALAAGKIIVCDRWSFFTDIVYGTARGLDIGLIQSIQAVIPFVPLDALFIFDPKFEVVFERKRALAAIEREHCRIEGASRDFFLAVSNFYHKASYRPLSDEAATAAQYAKKVIRIDSGGCMPRDCALAALTVVQGIIR